MNTLILHPLALASHPPMRVWWPGAEPTGSPCRQPAGAGTRPPEPPTAGMPKDSGFFSHVITASARLQEVLRYLESVAGTAEPILVTGETGVGKELIARGIHAASGRGGEFVVMDVASLDPTAFAATLFGHEVGDAAAAVHPRAGLVQTAAAGTLFLDDIGALSPTLQVRLLALLQSGEYRPAGADRPLPMATRIVASTHRDLRQLRDQGWFRPDLYYRLCTHQVHIPPLRERREDLPLLLQHCLEKATATLGKRRVAAPPEVLTLLGNCPFPGNVRELEALVFDALSRHDDRLPLPEAFRDAIACHGAAPLPAPAAAPRTVEGERTSGPAPAGLTLGAQLPQVRNLVDVLIDEALRRTKGNQSMAAHLVGISRQALNNRLRKRRQSEPATP